MLQEDQKLQNLHFHFQVYSNLKKEFLIYYKFLSLLKKIVIHFTEQFFETVSYFNLQ